MWKRKFILKLTDYVLCSHLCYKGSVRKNKGSDCWLKYVLKIIFNPACTPRPSAPQGVQRGAHRRQLPAGDRTDIRRPPLESGQDTTGGHLELTSCTPVHAIAFRNYSACLRGERSSGNVLRETYQTWRVRNLLLRSKKYFIGFVWNQGTRWAMKNSDKIRVMLDEKKWGVMTGSVPRFICQATLVLRGSGKPSAVSSDSAAEARGRHRASLRCAAVAGASAPGGALCLDSGGAEWQASGCPNTQSTRCTTHQWVKSGRWCLSHVFSMTADITDKMQIGLVPTE